MAACLQRPGVVRLQVWPGVSQLDLGAADLRIFSSPDAMAIGKQVDGWDGWGWMARLTVDIGECNGKIWKYVEMRWK